MDSISKDKGTARAHEVQLNLDILNSMKLAADPYYFNTSKHFNKADFVSRDVNTLISFLGKSEAEIYEASKKYLGREKYLFRYISAIKFWDNAVKYQLKKKSANLATLVCIFAIEGLVTEYSTSGNNDRFRDFLINHLGKDEKNDLLSKYEFGTPHPLGEGRFRTKHLVHRAVILDPQLGMYNRSYCSSGPNPICGCREWLVSQDLSKINHYVNQLGTLLYRMRNAVCHEGTYVSFTSMPFYEKNIGLLVPSVSDSFSNIRELGIGTFTSYTTDMTTERFIEIMKNGAWRLFETGSRTRHYKPADLPKRL